MDQSTKPTEPTATKQTNPKPESINLKLTKNWLEMVQKVNELVDSIVNEKKTFLTIVSIFFTFCY